jgi:hypothetical protein
MKTEGDRAFNSRRVLRVGHLSGLDCKRLVDCSKVLQLKAVDSDAMNVKNKEHQESGFNLRNMRLLARDCQRVCRRFNRGCSMVALSRTGRLIFQLLRGHVKTSDGLGIRLAPAAHSPLHTQVADVRLAR